MKLLDVILNSDTFSFFINGADLASDVAKRLESAGYEYVDPDSRNIFVERTRTASKYRFTLHPKEHSMDIQPAYGGTASAVSTIENPVFSQDIMVFILWLLRNEGSME